MNFHLFVITPTQIFYEGEVKSLSVMLPNGSIQFLAHHREELAVVADGKGAWVSPDGQTTTFCTAGGVLYFANNTAYLMVEHVAYQKDWDDSAEARANYLRQEQSRRRQSMEEHRLSAIALAKAFGAMSKTQPNEVDD